MANETQPRPNTAVETYVRWNKVSGFALLGYGLIGVFAPLPLSGAAAALGAVNVGQGYGIEGFRKWRARKKAEKAQTHQLAQSGNVVKFEQHVPKSDPRQSRPLAA